MKKKILMAAVLCMMFGLAACGKKGEAESSADTSVAAASTEVSEATVEPSSEEIEMNSIYATVQETDGSKLTVEAENGKSLSLDISKAELNPAYPLMQGDEVEIAFLGSEPIDGMAVASVIMVTPFELVAEDYNEDPMLWGTITAVDDTSITVQEDDGGRSTAEGGEASAGSYTFTIAPYAQIITKGGLLPGSAVLVDYVEEEDGTLTAYRLCTEDMQEDPAGEVFAFTGTIENVEQGIIYLKTADGTEFRFSAEDDLLAEAKQGETVQLRYSGSIRQRVLMAEDILTSEESAS